MFMDELSIESFPGYIPEWIRKVYCMALKGSGLKHAKVVFTSRYGYDAPKPRVIYNMTELKDGEMTLQQFINSLQYEDY